MNVSFYGLKEVIYELGELIYKLKEDFSLWTKDQNNKNDKSFQKGWCVLVELMGFLFYSGA